MSLWTAFKKEMKEQSRTHRLLIAIVLLTAFGMLSPLLAKMLPDIFAAIPGGEAYAGLIPPPTLNDAVAQYIKNVTQFGVLLALLFCMGAVAVEKDKGTAALILSKPMPRGSFLLAKFLAVSVTLLLALAGSALAGYSYTLFLFEPLPVMKFLAMNGLIWVYLLVYAAVTLFFSTLTRTQFIAIGGAAGVLILSSILGSLPTIGNYTPDALVANAKQMLSGGPVTNWGGLWVSLAIILVSLIGSWLALRKQEL